MSDWMTQGLRAAEARLTDSMRELSAARSALGQELTEIDKQFPPLDTRARLALAAHYRSGSAGPALRDLQRRVDAGETTWEDIKSGSANPEWVRSYYHGQQKLRTLLQAAREGQDIGEFLDDQHEAGNYFAANQKETPRRGEW